MLKKLPKLPFNRSFIVGLSDPTKLWLDPVVFFKILLVGYLNNINSDRQLIAFCSDSLSIRLFLGYDVHEQLPWHSTISRTRGLYGEEVFLNLFKEVLKMCVSKGMVRGKRQAVDSVFIKANASMDSLVEKEVLEDAGAFVNEFEENSEYKVTSTRKKLVERHHDWKAEAYKGMPANLPTICIVGNPYFSMIPFIAFMIFSFLCWFNFPFLVIESHCCILRSA